MSNILENSEDSVFLGSSPPGAISGTCRVIIEERGRERRCLLIRVSRARNIRAFTLILLIRKYKIIE